MKKVIFGLFLTITTIFGATVGANNSGKIMDKAYLDIYFDNGEVNYQYVNYMGDRFELSSRTLNKVFDLYRARKLKKGKFVISGMLEIPNSIKVDKVLLIVKGNPRIGMVENPNGFGDRCRDNSFWGNNTQFNYTLARYNSSGCSYGWQVYINGKEITKERNKVKVNSDSMGNEFLNIKIEGYGINTSNQKFAIQNIDSARKGIEKLSFFIETSGQNGRGSDSIISTHSLRAYSLED